MFPISIERTDSGKVVVKKWIHGEARWERIAVVDDWEDAEAIASTYAGQRNSS